MTTETMGRRGYTARSFVPVSVIVCTRYRANSLARCLASLGAMDASPDEVVVVDNTVGDPDCERVVAEAGARYLLEPRGGLSRARNAGALAAEAEIVALIDDDAVAEPGWLAGHEDALADRAVSATTGRILPL